MTTFHPFIVFAIQLAGLFHFLLAGANFLLAGMLDYRGNMARVSNIIRQIFYVHALYIVIVLVGFGGICLLFPEDLAGATPLGRFFCGFMAAFWAIRVVIQLGYYDGETKKQYPIGNFCFACLFIFFVLVFITATIASL